MKFFPAKYPAVFRWLYPHRLSLQKAPKILFLTFDDGPVPEITPWVLDQLDQYHAKATFFCIGDNIQKHPGIFKQVLSKGHGIGNHTFNHLNGWKTNPSTYVQNTLLAEKEIEKKSGKRSEKRGKSPQELSEEENTKNNLFPSKDIEKAASLKLFRPPFGKIKNSQARELVKRGYHIVMWDVLSWDFRDDIGEHKCLQNVIKNAEEGSIIVFHDSLKAAKNLKMVLPEVLKYFHERGFMFKSL